MPTTAPTMTRRMSWAVSEAISRPAPAAASRALGSRRIVAVAAACSSGGAAAGMWRSALTARNPATVRNGIRPRNTRRHVVYSPTIAAIEGPITPGTTHAVESSANIRGCSRSGRVRPIAT